MALYDLSIPVLRRTLANLAGTLKKGEAYLAEKGLPESTLTEAQLIEDMKPLTAQVQFASDSAKGAAARLSGGTAPSFADTETTFAELYERIDKTIAYLDSVPPEAINGREDVVIVMKLPSAELSFTGLTYLQSFALPNTFFHTTTAYAIMRHKGVPLGKRDFLGGV